MKEPIHHARNIKILNKSPSSMKLLNWLVAKFYILKVSVPQYTTATSGTGNTTTPLRNVI
jgi:hypothetical protein